MRKQLSITLACFLLTSATAFAQSWKPYENTAKGKTYETSDCVTLLVLLQDVLLQIKKPHHNSNAVKAVVRKTRPKLRYCTD